MFKMKKQILLTITGIILLVIVGGLIADNKLIGQKTISTIKLTDDKLSLIQSRGIDSIDVQSSPITCNNNYCWSDLYQENVIQTQWRTERSYCSSYDNVNGTITCSEYVDYTPEELTAMKDNFITQRLNDYASLIQDQDNSNSDTIQTDSGGRITTQ